jgi:hypothetical protein
MSSSSNFIAAIQIPGGGELLGFINSHSSSTECLAITSLQSQVAPLIVSMSCQLKVLKLLKPLIDVIHGLPSPSVQALEEFSKAAVELEPCLVTGTPLGILPFLNDLLCVEIKSLNCLLHSLQRVIEQGSNELSSSSMSPARNVLNSYPPIVGNLKLAGELFQMAGLTLPEEPVLENGTDLASLNADQSAIVTFTTALRSVADAIGGC